MPKQEVASIRYKNPGAMWGKNAIAKKWGATATIGLNDGLGQGNNIAVFPTFEQGAAAQFDLWRAGYCNMTLGNAIRKWSGGNWSAPYAKSLTAKTGLSMTAMIDKTVLASPTGWKLLKAQAEWEAGKSYPMTDQQWQQAQKMCFGTTVPTSTAKKKTVVVAATVVTAAPVIQGAAHSGMHWGLVVAIVFGIACIATGVFLYFHSKREGAAFNHDVSAQ